MDEGAAPADADADGDGVARRCLERAADGLGDSEAGHAGGSAAWEAAARAQSDLDPGGRRVARQEGCPRGGDQHARRGRWSRGRNRGSGRHPRPRQQRQHQQTAEQEARARRPRSRPSNAGAAGRRGAEPYDRGRAVCRGRAIAGGKPWPGGAPGRAVAGRVIQGRDAARGGRVRKVSPWAGVRSTAGGGQVGQVRGAVPGGAMACGCSGRHINRPSRRACRTARGRPLVSGDHENPCGRDTRGSAPDFREIWQIRTVRREVTVAS